MLGWNYPENLLTMRGMASRKRIKEDTVPEISRRVRLLRIAIAGDDLGAQARFARQAGFTTAAWNNYEKGSRIGIDAALKLVQTFYVTLDWIYIGNAAFMPHDLMQKIRKLEEEEKGQAA